LLFNLETVQAFASKLQKEALSGQTDLFGGLSDPSTIQPTIVLQSSPIKHSDRERLAWERELMGLYISAHPLDNYDAYFEEQTVSLMQITPENDGKTVTVGGLISTVRTIITKNGTKMAFIRIEDKTGETEIIVFPNLYEKIGAKLVQDAVIRSSGKITARDRDGNLASDVKIIADDMQFITDQELSGYESTGRKMKNPKVSSKVQATRVVANLPDKVEDIKKLYVHIKDPDDRDSLLLLKKVCSDYPGIVDIVLVLGDEKKSAIKLPFKVDGSDSLVASLGKILSEDSVKIK